MFVILENTVQPVCPAALAGTIRLDFPYSNYFQDSEDNA
jgi:hypothetical protein